MVLHGMKRSEITDLYTKYIGDWGSRVTEYRFDAIRNGQVVKTVTKAPMSKPCLQAAVSSNTLKETTSYDVAAVRLKAVDEHGNLLYFCGEPLKISAEGPIEIIGGDMVSLKGGMAGTYVRSTGAGGSAVLTVSNPQLGVLTIPFEITVD